MTDLMPVDWRFLLVVLALAFLAILIPLGMVAIKHAILWLIERFDK